jgi:hypothetical protein
MIAVFEWLVNLLGYYIDKIVFMPTARPKSPTREEVCTSWPFKKGIDAWFFGPFIYWIRIKTTCGYTLPDFLSMHLFGHEYIIWR